MSIEQLLRRQTIAHWLDRNGLALAMMLGLGLAFLLGIGIMSWAPTHALGFNWLASIIPLLIVCFPLQERIQRRIRTYRRDSDEDVEDALSDAHRYYDNLPRSPYSIEPGDDSDSDSPSKFLN